MEQGEEDVDWMMEPAGGKKGGGGGGMMIDRKKRFSEEQIKSLESMFATQTKLEPRQKLQLARELGLQPRQVAIWFQNKRARWKSKQLERQYAALRDDYDALLSSYDQLKKDKQALINQLEKLAEMLREPGGGKCGDDNAGAAAGDDVRLAVAGMSMKDEFVDAGVANKLYSASEGGGGSGKLSLFGEEDDEAGLFLRPSLQLPSTHDGGFTASGPAEFQQPSPSPFPFHSSWPSSAEQTCSSSQWWEFESPNE